MASTFAHIAPRANNVHCTKETCPVSDSTYGYAPSEAASILFLVLFALSAIVYAVQAVIYRKRWLAFSIVLCIGSICEAIGYVARQMLHNDPFSDSGFKISVVLLTFAPAFVSGGIYLLLKHLTLAFGPSLSRLRPALYTWVFVSCDIVSILLQAAGGAISAIATDKSLLDVGVDVMIAGLAFQVATLLVFGLLAGDYLLKARRQRDQLSPSGVKLAHETRFRLFLIAVFTAYLAIFIRCCYRVAELSGGWGNPIMRKEAEFIVLDSVMVAAAVILLNIFHPGVYFRNPSKEGFDGPHTFSDSGHSQEEAAMKRNVGSPV